MDFLMCGSCDFWKAAPDALLGKCGCKDSRYHNKPRVKSAVRCDQHPKMQENNLTADFADNTDLE